MDVKGGYVDKKKKKTLIIGKCIIFLETKLYYLRSSDPLFLLVVCHHILYGQGLKNTSFRFRNSVTKHWGYTPSPQIRLAPALGTRRENVHGTWSISESKWSFIEFFSSLKYPQDIYGEKRPVLFIVSERTLSVQGIWNFFYRETCRNIQQEHGTTEKLIWTPSSYTETLRRFADHLPLSYGTRVLYSPKIKHQFLSSHNTRRSQWVENPTGVRKRTGWFDCSPRDILFFPCQWYPEYYTFITELNIYHLSLFIIAGIRRID